MLSPRCDKVSLTKKTNLRVNPYVPTLAVTSTSDFHFSIDQDLKTYWLPAEYMLYFRCAALPCSTNSTDSCRAAQHQQHEQLQGTAPAKVRDADPHFFTLPHVRQVCGVAIICFGEEDRTMTEHYVQQTKSWSLWNCWRTLRVLLWHT